MALFFAVLFVASLSVASTTNCDPGYVRESIENSVDYICVKETAVTDQDVLKELEQLENDSVAEATDIINNAVVTSSELPSTYPSSEPTSSDLPSTYPSSEATSSELPSSYPSSEPTNSTSEPLSSTDYTDYTTALLSSTTGPHPQHQEVLGAGCELATKNAIDDSRYIQLTCGAGKAITQLRTSGVPEATCCPLPDNQ